MITLLFNTTTKFVKVYEGELSNSKLLHHFTNVPTVKIREEGFYEVMEKGDSLDGQISTQIPIARFPIQNTVMIIEK